MTLMTRTFLLVALLGLSACASPGRFGAGDNTVNLNGGGPNDPANVNSPAYFTQTIGDRVLFAVDESTISPASRQVLDGQAAWLQANAEFDILIEGHADEQGTREYNLALSAKRASSVQQYLIAQGIAPARIKTVPYGKERPLALCSAESCYSQNRRAVTVLNSGLTS